MKKFWCTLRGSLKSLSRLRRTALSGLQRDVHGLVSVWEMSCFMPFNIGSQMMFMGIFY